MVPNKKPRLTPGWIEEKVMRSGRLKLGKVGLEMGEEPGPVLIGRTPKEFAQDQNLKVVFRTPPT